MNKPKHFLSSQNKLGETPIWVPEEKALYWIDWGGQPTNRFDFITQKHSIYQTDLPVTSIARRRSGGFIAVSDTAIYHWEPTLNTYQLLVGLAETGNPDIFYNDCAVDRKGRLLIGSVDSKDVFSPTGSLYQLDWEAHLKKLDTGYATANGIGVSPDGKTVYVSDMRQNQIIALDYDSEAGEVANRRVFAKVPEEEGMPDGLIVDADGFVWSGHWAGWRLTRYDPSGKVERQVLFPVEHVISFAFGGDDLDQLFVTTAWWGYAPEKRREFPTAGDLFVYSAGMKGLVEPEFEG